MKRLVSLFLRDRNPGDARGLALVEFAVGLPVLLLLYLGGWQISDAIACNRKVTITARALADLTSQYASLPTAQIQSILNASTQIMAPYDATNATVMITELYTDNNGNTTVYWSQAGSGTGRTQGSSYTLPAGMATNGTYLILGEVAYNYTPVVLYGLSGPIPLSDRVYMSPRVSTLVTKTP